MSAVMQDWKIFSGYGAPHKGLERLPEPPPWRFPRDMADLDPAGAASSDREAKRAAPFRPTPKMVEAVNAAIYLRRPLLVTGKPGTGKSTLIAKVAHELMLGDVLRWPISSRSTVRGGVYEYDAVGRLQAGGDAKIEDYLTLGPLGTALMAQLWPRALLIDEIDKSDLDFANDLLNVIEEGEYHIPELHRLSGKAGVKVKDFDKKPVTVESGQIKCVQFPIVVMTSNAERDFPAPFLRRCVRLSVDPPAPEDLANIVRSHLKDVDDAKLREIVAAFVDVRKENKEVSIDQLLNATFLTVPLSSDAEPIASDAQKIRSLLLAALNSES